MLTVITSLNPNIKRLDAYGHDIGEKYQRQCVESWRDAGARVFSVNTEAEIARLVQLNYPVKFVAVESTPYMPGGRPLPSISDALNVAKSLHDSIVVLANSDIMLSECHDRMRISDDMLDRGDFLFSSRMDIASLGSKSGQIYPYGYDVFAFHSSKAWDLDAGTFTFGTPWWDYWLPVAALFSGLKLKFLKSDDFHHLLHDQAWSWSAWNFGFALFIQKLQSRVNPSERIANAGDFGAGFSNFLLTDSLGDIQKRISSNSAAPHELGMEMSRYIRGVLSSQSLEIQ